MEVRRTPGAASPGGTGKGPEPDRRALEAMASAASRARRAEHAPVIDPGDDETGTRRLLARSTSSGPVTHGPTPHPTVRRSAAESRPWAGRGLGSRLDGRRARAWLASGTAALLVLAVAGVALSLSLHPPRPATHRTGAARRPAVPHRNAETPRAKTGTTSRTHGTAHRHHHPRTKGAASATPMSSPPTSAPAPASTGSPRLSSVSPTSGGAGQAVVVVGSGLFSANGEVLAYFGSTPAPTSCGTQTSCTVTVPDLGGSPSTVPLTIVTASGRSNALSFTYR